MHNLPAEGLQYLSGQVGSGKAQRPALGGELQIKLWLAGLQIVLDTTHAIQALQLSAQDGARLHEGVIAVRAQLDAQGINLSRCILYHHSTRTFGHAHQLLPAASEFVDVIGRLITQFEGDLAALVGLRHHLQVENIRLRTVAAQLLIRGIGCLFNTQQIGVSHPEAGIVIHGQLRASGVPGYIREKTEPYGAGEGHGHDQDKQRDKQDDYRVTVDNRPMNQRLVTALVQPDQAAVGAVLAALPERRDGVSRPPLAGIDVRQVRRQDQLRFDDRQDQAEGNNDGELRVENAQAPLDMGQGKKRSHGREHTKQGGHCYFHRPPHGIGQGISMS